MSQLDRLATWVRTRPILHKAAHLAVRALPNIRYTKRFPEFGPLCFRLRQNRWFLWAPFLKGEEMVLGMFERIVQPGDTMYDIGANIGVYTRAVHHWFGAEHVVAFEPMTQNIDLLQRNIALGDMKENATVYALAIGDAEREEALQIDDMTSGTAVLNSVTDGEASVGRQAMNLSPITETVKVVRLDTLIRDDQLTPPDSIKIDVEGAECMVLDGAEAVLREHTPRLLIATHGTDKVLGCLTRLNDLGYFCYGFIRHDDGSRSWGRLMPEDAGRIGNSNFIASVDEGEVSGVVEGRGPGRRSGSDEATEG